MSMKWRLLLWVSASMTGALAYQMVIVPRTPIDWFGVAFSVMFAVVWAECFYIFAERPK